MAEITQVEGAVWLAARQVFTGEGQTGEGQVTVILTHEGAAYGESFMMRLSPSAAMDLANTLSNAALKAGGLRQIGTVQP